MKVAIYIEQGVTQLVLTPDTEWEKKVLSNYPTGSILRIKRGEFYETQGGYWRQGSTFNESLILRIDQETTPPQGEHAEYPDAI